MRSLLILLALILLAAPVAAQDDDCGNGLPCGPIPWPLPGWPIMSSPTPLGVVGEALPGQPTFTPTPTPTDTPEPTITPTLFFEEDPLEEAIETLQAVFEATTVPVTGVDDQEVSGDDIAGFVDPTFFGYVRGFSVNMLGPFAPLGSLLLAIVGLTIFTTIIRVTLPVIAALIGFIRKVVSFVMDLIPFV
jgi:hypothetical protein